MEAEPTKPDPMAKARAAKAAKKAAQQAAQQVAHAAETKPDEYEGITTTECPLACNSERCVITGESICGHPHKGGLQAKYQGDLVCIERFRQARIRLARQRVKEM